MAERKLILLLLVGLSACAPLDGVPDFIRLRDGSSRAGTAIRLADGRLIAVQTRPLQAGPLGADCGVFIPPNSVWITDDPAHCPSLELLLAHELGHARGLPHTRTGIMAAPPQDEDY